VCDSVKRKLVMLEGPFDLIECRGIAMGWTGVDMSTPLLPEVVPEIDANPVSFYSEGGGWGVVHGLELDSPFASNSDCPLTPRPEALPLDPAGGSATRSPL